jgi:hypothetical protein
VPAKPERRKCLDVAGDGFGHVPGVEEHLVGKRHGPRIHVLRTLVISASPCRSSVSASFLPIHPLSPKSLPVRSLTSEVTCAESLTLPSVTPTATILCSWLNTKCSLKPKHHPILLLPRAASPRKPRVALSACCGTPAVRWNPYNGSGSPSPSGRRQTSAAARKDNA